LRITPAAFLASPFVNHSAPLIEEIISLMRAGASGLSPTASARWFRRRLCGSLVIGLLREALSAQARGLQGIDIKRFLPCFGDISAALVVDVTPYLCAFHLDLVPFRWLVGRHLYPDPAQPA
jgi:hypothetical protein